MNLLNTRRKVKIIATLGPASQNTPVIERLIEAGMDVSRLNFSHGTHDYHGEVFKAVREASAKTKKYVGILQDLSGPKIRVGSLRDGGHELKTGDLIHLTIEGASPSLGSKTTLQIPVTSDLAAVIQKDLSKGQRALFDDGKMTSYVREVGKTDFIVEIASGGLLTSKKGMNFPDTLISLPSVTDKDLRDLKFGLELGVDIVALSFVREASEIERLRKEIRSQSNYDPLIVAKIERHEAVENSKSIIKAADGLMVARGDMAVEIGVERVPAVQKGLIYDCNHAGVPVITATQMLESMTTASIPTRAEASDVANAVFDGTDAVMLSGETAVGDDPVKVVRTMAKIAEEAEQTAQVYATHQPPLPPKSSIVDSIEFSASRIAQALDAPAIACLTNSGRSAMTLSKYRPTTPIVAFTDLEQTLRKLSVFWGVGGVHIPPIIKDRAENIEMELKARRVVKKGDNFVITMGPPEVSRGKTNTVRVKTVE